MREEDGEREREMGGRGAEGGFGGGDSVHRER